MIRIAGIIKMNRKELKCSSLLMLSIEFDPITKAAHEASANDPNKSAFIPATPPTLSPILSAIVAVFRGLFSGSHFYIFPTKSDPKRAAFVNIPPPALAKSTTVDPSSPYPAIDSKRF
jgi:hypothetical protein